MSDSIDNGYTKGVGIDIGTMNLVAARQKGTEVDVNRIRDAFLDLPHSAKRMLRLSDVSFVERDDELLLLGDHALEMANIFGREARRPLSEGLISSKEIDSVEVLGFLIQSILKDPIEPNEVCCYSVPAAPVDKDRDIIYHKGVFARIISSLGYKPMACNEAMAIIYSECASTGFSGLSFSFGSGMTNVALSINTIECLTFSIARGGDWIDKGAAQSLGQTQARMCTIKEQGFDVGQPEGREQEALSFYYKELISYSLDVVVREFEKIRDKFVFSKPIPIIISGGTSKATSFHSLFLNVFATKRDKFPIRINTIRTARDPLNSVAKGLLIQAMQEYV